MSFDKLLEENEKAYDAMMAKYKEQTTKQFVSDDDRLWYPQADKAGNGSALIRFLPHKDETRVPWVQQFQHAFQGPSGIWLIENCPTTLKRPCPICEANSKLWNEGGKGQDLARKQKRKVYYYSNAYIIKDPGNEENNGQVKIFRYGQKIYQMLMSKLFPDTALKEVKKIDPFHLIKGCDFQLVFNKGAGGFRSYDHSTFHDVGPLLDGDKESLREVYDSMYDLDEFIDPSIFKSSEELLKRLNLVNGTAVKAEPEVREQVVVEEPALDLDVPEVTDFDAFFDELKD